MERYYIRNCIGEVVGNPKGYTTYKGASMIFNRRQMQADLIDLAHKYGIEGSGKNSVLIGSIKLESPTVTVLRVEGPKGFGMYSQLWGPCGLPTNDAHPIVANDSLYQKAAKAYDAKCQDDTLTCRNYWNQHRSEPDGHRFGFLDQDMLRRWIYDDSWIEKLSAAGAVLCTYIVEADHAIIGRTQVTFNADNARCVNRMPLAKIL